MKKEVRERYVILLSVLMISIVLIYAGCQGRTDHTNQTQNVFDEIYYVESSHITYNSFWRELVRSDDPLSDLKTIDNTHKKDVYDPDMGAVSLGIYYKEKLPEDTDDLWYGFSDRLETHDVNEMAIGMSRDLSKEPKVTLYVHFVYHPEEKNFTKNIILNYKVRVSEEETAANLQEYGLTIAEVERWSDDILKNRIVKDWLSVYDSKYSMDDMGEFTIKTEWNKE